MHLGEKRIGALPTLEGEVGGVFDGYRFPLPKNSNYALEARNNLESIGLELAVAGHECWSKLLNAKLTFMLGLPTEVPDFRNEELTFQLFQYGEVFLGPAIRVAGTVGHCHFNSSFLWSQNPGALDFVRGFGMRDGEWFVHSWCAPRNERQVIETSQTMDFYYGFRFPVAWAKSITRRENVMAKKLIVAPRTKICARKTRLGTKLSLRLPPRFCPVSEGETSVV